MINEKAYKLGSQRSAIRELFEYGKTRMAAVGKENVYDFSLGNPSIPAPEAVKEAFLDIVANDAPLAVHGYTSAQGDEATRRAIAENLEKRTGRKISPQALYITCGAAAALTSCIGALTISSDTEFIAIAPFFPEYRCFAEIGGGKLKVVPADEENFQINFEALEQAINQNTQAIIINSPNNPSGTVYTEETIKKLAELLTKKSEEYQKPIFIISDEPYRELVYNGQAVPFVMNYYKNTLVCYSYSKSLSMPGERIGYVLVNEDMDDWKMVYDAVAGAARSFGYVCAPSLVQRVIARCADVMPDLTTYKENRDLLYDTLTSWGYFCAMPDGAFYLFVRAPEGDGEAFSERAKKKDILIVGGAGFGCPAFVRLSYCVDTDMIKRALPLFKELMDETKRQ